MVTSTFVSRSAVLTPFLTADELALARTYSARLERELRTQFNKRLRRLKNLFVDRPLKAALAKEWLLAMPPERLKLFAELTTFEAALFRLPPTSDNDLDWQAGLAAADAYPGVVPHTHAGLHRYLLELRALAIERQKSGHHPSPTTLAQRTQTLPGRRAGRRTASRPATTCG